MFFCGWALENEATWVMNMQEELCAPVWRGGSENLFCPSKKMQDVWGEVV